MAMSWVQARTFNSLETIQMLSSCMDLMAFEHGSNHSRTRVRQYVKQIPLISYLIVF